MPEAMSYWDSRKSQENRAILKKINDSLKDDLIDNTEAKEINEKYKNLKSNILAITKEELASFAKWLWLESSASLWKTINKLKEKSNSTSTPANTPSSPAQEAENIPHVTQTEPQQEDTSEINESTINKQEIISYFGIKNPENLVKWLDEAGLNLFKMLDWYKNYIENNLQWLDPKILTKIKQSILIKTWLILDNTTFS